MRSFIFLLAILPLVFAASQAATTIRTTTSPQSFAINGVECPEVTSWSGGDISGTVVETTLGTGPIKKHISQIGYEPIIVKAVPPLSPALIACLADLCSGNSTSVTLQLFASDPQPLQATNALLYEAQFPALDGASKAPCEITFVFRAETVRPSTSTTRSSGRTAKSSSTLASNFSFSLGNLETSHVSSIEPFTLSRAAASGAIGAFHEATTAVGPTKVSNLTVVTSNASAASWKAWRDDFLINGNRTDDKELEGSLTLLGADMKTPQLVLQLHHVGITRYAAVSPTGEAIARSAASLYCEQITVVPSSGSNAATPAPATPTPATPTTTTTQPLPTKTLVAATTTHAKDAGLRDPAGFPRPDGLVRTSYSKSDYDTQLNETANYSSEKDVDAVLESYLKILADNGWKKESLNESGSSPTDHMILSNWRKDKTQVDLRLYAAKTGSTVYMSVTTAK